MLQTSANTIPHIGEKFAAAARHDPLAATIMSHASTGTRMSTLFERGAW